VGPLNEANDWHALLVHSPSKSHPEAPMEKLSQVKTLRRPAKAQYYFKQSGENSDKTEQQ
jgi:hypothetical protein